jgi:hypothetical protein
VVQGQPDQQGVVCTEPGRARPGAAVDDHLHELGIRTVVIPRKGDPATPGGT